MDANSDDDGRPVRLSLQLIVKRHLPEDAHSWNHEKIINLLNQITHLRLDRENISEIDNLELLGAAVTNVYLQENRISVIQNLECLQNLQFLTLSGNRISKLENLRQHTRLLVLDLSNNCIDLLGVDELPVSLIILNLTGNPCCNKPDYRASVLGYLPRLKQLDSQEIDEEEDEASAVELSMKPLFSGEEQATAAAIPRSLGTHRLPNIDACLQDLTTEMLLRSQSRVEDNLQLHLQHRMEMDNLRLSHHIKPT